jgi:predicted Zn-dependent peptidase
VTITGTFDPAAARDWAERTLGRLPGGKRLETPHPALSAGGRIVTVPEKRARRPQVTFAWEFGELGEDVISALEFGATLVKIYTDGALGMRVDAALNTYLGGNIFMFQVTLAHEANKTEARDMAEGLLRYLTRTAAADDVFGAALVLGDRALMSSLDDPLARAERLGRLEFLLGDDEAVARHAQRHWALWPEDIGPFTRPLLEGGRFTLQVRPLDPLPRRGF